MKSDYQIQAESFAKKHNVKLSVIGNPQHDYYFEDDKEPRYIFKLRLSRGRKSYTFKFGQSIANSYKTPSMYDVLACLTKYDVGTFENFCSDFGYDIDSRKAEKTYKAVLKEWEAVERLFNDVLEELQEIS